MSAEPMWSARSHPTIASFFAIFLCLVSPLWAKCPAFSAIFQDNPVGWQKVDAGPFSILAPPGWEFHQLPGVDTYVGEFVGDGASLAFSFGRYAKGCLNHYKKPMYAIANRSIGGLHAKIVSSRTPGHGMTGVYFRKVNRRNAFCLYGEDLTAAQQELALKIFETIRFGGPMPKYLLPPPPPPPKKPE